MQNKVAGLTEERSTKVGIIYENILCITYFAGAAVKHTVLYRRRDQV